VGQRAQGDFQGMEGKSSLDVPPKSILDGVMSRLDQLRAKHGEKILIDHTRQAFLKPIPRGKIWGPKIKTIDSATAVHKGTGKNRPQGLFGRRE